MKTSEIRIVAAKTAPIVIALMFFAACDKDSDKVIVATPSITEAEKTEIKISITDLNQRLERIEARLGISSVPAPSRSAPAKLPEVNIVATMSEKWALATVRSGEGIEHALLRQLISEPKHFGFDGDASDSSAVKRWAGQEAHEIAVKAGYFDWKFGGEIRVRDPDRVAYVLSKNSDGSLTVDEFVKKGGSFSGGSENTRKVADSYSQSRFLAQDDGEGNFKVTSSYAYFELPDRLG